MGKCGGTPPTATFPGVLISPGRPPAGFAHHSRTKARHTKDGGIVRPSLCNTKSKVGSQWKRATTPPTTAVWFESGAGKIIINGLGF